jgi:hypothetical protein
MPQQMPVAAPMCHTTAAARMYIWRPPTHPWLSPGDAGVVAVDLYQQLAMASIKTVQFPGPVLVPACAPLPVLPPPPSPPAPSPWP